jgi:RsiW-degrading membrane proteinase PrsW (M82 family)
MSVGHRGGTISRSPSKRNSCDAVRRPLEHGFWALAITCAVLACAATGCTPHLAGTNDAALEYAAKPEPAGSPSLDLRTLSRRIKARLIADGVAADVERIQPNAATGAPGRVRVVVDADVVDPVNALLLWPGDVTIYRAKGPAAAIDGAGGEADGVLLAEPLAAGSSQPLVVPLPALAGRDAAPPALASVDRARGGRALALTLEPGARSALASLEKEDPRSDVVISRDRTVLATLGVAEALASPVVVETDGDPGIAAYSRAAKARRLLDSPRLPPMTLLAAARMPVRVALATACAVLPFVLSFAWLLFLRRFDRARPEPMWLVALTFGLGALSVIPAVAFEIGLSRASPWLDPAVVTLGGQWRALPLTLAVFTLTIGAVEEGAKWLAAWSFAAHRREFDEPVDGIIYGSAASLGFAAAENVKYFAIGRMSGAVIAARTFMTVPAHMFFGAIWGFAMGRHLLARNEGPGPWLRFFALAALAHGAFDAMLATDGLQLLATPIVLALAIVFVWLLRRALRHGTVTEAGEALPSALSSYYRVGSSRAFYGCAAGMVVSAFAVTVLGSYYELLHHRVGALFVVSASMLLALFGVASYGASETIPLDVVVDDRGVTFAGVRTPWSAIASVRLAPHKGASRTGKTAFVEMQTDARSVRLGPAPATRAAALEAAIAERVRSHPG